MIEFIANSESQTEQFGHSLAQAIHRDIVVALDGTLGAGKTWLVRSIASEWGFDPRDVVSPTFTICIEHSCQNRLPEKEELPTSFKHVDAYRIDDDDQWFELGFDEAISDGEIFFIEWAGKVRHLLPDDLLSVSIEVVDGPESRRFVVHPSGPKSEKICKQLRDVLP